VTARAGLGRIVVALVVTVCALILLFSYHTSRGQASASTSVVRSTGDTATGPGTVVAGDAVDTRWGVVQVQVTVSGGKLTGTTVLQSPDGNPRDVQINTYALPVLATEALAAQSASIDTVSGATVTSDGYISSLQSALDAAGL
jgi:uncharacterized protein with FMN-binding domain